MYVYPRITWFHLFLALHNKGIHIFTFFLSFAWGNICCKYPLQGPLQGAPFDYSQKNARYKSANFSMRYGLGKDYYNVNASKITEVNLALPSFYVHQYCFLIFAHPYMYAPGSFCFNIFCPRTTVKTNSSLNTCYLFFIGVAGLRIIYIYCVVLGWLCNVYVIFLLATWI